MSTEQITVTIDSQRLADALALASETGQPLEQLLTEMLDEAVKTRRCPGIRWIERNNQAFEELQQKYPHLVGPRE